MNCLFCRIAAGEIPANKVLDTPDLLAFRDINPVAPTHILIIPRRHIASVAELSPMDGELVGKMFQAAKDLAASEGVTEGGFRTVFNSGPDAGQTVFHLHLHLLGGRSFSWPPG